MKLRQDLVLADFFDTVRRCEGEVYYVTAEGDNLNLKSQLSQYVFTAAFLSKTLEIDGCVRCDLPGDAQTLLCYERGGQV